MKKVTLSEVARKAGVSVTTASLVLNPGKSQGRIGEDCARRVHEVAERLGYATNYHAQSMKLGRSMTIGVALDTDYEGLAAARQGELGNGYFSALIGGIELYVRQRGFLTSIIGPVLEERSPERALLGLRQGRFDGLVVPGVILRRGSRVFLEQVNDLPIVVISPRRPTALPTVEFNEAAGVRLAVESLVKLGHRELLWLGPHRPGSPEVANLREQMFMTSVWDAGLRGASCRMAELPLEGDERDFRGRVVEAARRALLDWIGKPASPRFTAIVCFNDLVAIGATQALRERNLRVPRDVSIVGFDDHEAILNDPPLTSVRHRLGEMGRRAAEMVFEMIANPALCAEWRNRIEIIEPELEPRESTGPCPKKKR
jgi:LacI family transcriptional regulator